MLSVYHSIHANVVPLRHRLASLAWQAHPHSLWYYSLCTKWTRELEARNIKLRRDQAVIHIFQEIQGLFPLETFGARRGEQIFAMEGAGKKSFFYTQTAFD